MSHNDRGMMNMSGWQDYLVSDGMLTANVGNDDTGFFYPCIFGDSMYVPSEVIQKALDADCDVERTLNLRLNSGRVCIENHSALTFNEYAVLTQKRRHHLFKNKENVYKLGIVCFFLTNCYSCLRNNSIGKRFGMNKVPLQTYLPLYEELVMSEGAPLAEDGLF